MKSCDLFPTYPEFVHGSGFIRWLNSQFFWRLDPSGSSQQLSFQLGRSAFLFCYGISAIILGILSFYVALGLQPMYLSGLQQDITSRAYEGLLITFVNINLLFFLPFVLTLFGILDFGFKGYLIVDAENRLASKGYSCFNLSLWSRTWRVDNLKEISVGSYGKGFISSRIFQLRLTAEDQPTNAILTCGNAFHDPLRLMAERIATILNVPLQTCSSSKFEHILVHDREGACFGNDSEAS